MKRLISVMMWAAVLGGGCTGDAATNEEAHELVAGNVYVIGSSAMSGVITHAAIGHQRGRALDASRH